MYLVLSFCVPFFPHFAVKIFSWFNFILCSIVRNFAVLLRNLNCFKNVSVSWKLCWIYVGLPVWDALVWFSSFGHPLYWLLPRLVAWQDTQVRREVLTSWHFYPVDSHWKVPARHQHNQSIALILLSQISMNFGSKGPHVGMLTMTIRQYMCKQIRVNHNLQMVQD